MKILNCEQGSQEWFSARLGVPSASSYKKLITSTGKKASTFKDYCYELAVERLTGERTEIFTNKHMERGTELEPDARSFFEILTNYQVEEVGFVLEDGGRFGCSPDGLMDGSGLEIKCPMAKTHMKYLDEDRCPPEYYAQVQGCMLVTDRSQWKFMSYHPDLKPLIITVKRDQDFIDKLKESLIEADEYINYLLEKYHA